MVFVIIPVHNRLFYTRACLESLAKQRFSEVRIIVVDDGSTDGTADYIRSHHPATQIISGNGDLWWTGAINLGVKWVLENSKNADDFVLTLNNDLEVQPDYIENLVSVYRQSKPSLVGSTVVDIEAPDRVTFCGTRWNIAVAKQRPAVNLPVSLAQLQKEIAFVSSDLLNGRGVLIPKSVYEQIGLYDEVNFPHYAADEDFSVRAKRAGYQLVVATGGVVYSHLKESNLYGIHRIKGIRYWYDFFFSIKSSFNLKYRYKWAKKHARLPWLYFLLDFGRICYSQFRQVISRPAVSSVNH